jgi:hypothetical protein
LIAKVGIFFLNGHAEMPLSSLIQARPGEANALNILPIAQAGGQLAPRLLVKEVKVWY